jgi:hypothetical protein
LSLICKIKKVINIAIFAINAGRFREKMYNATLTAFKKEKEKEWATSEPDDLPRCKTYIELIPKAKVDWERLKRWVSTLLQIKLLNSFCC